MSNIAELYSKGLSKNLLEIYWFILERYELEDIKRSLSLHAINPEVGQFMPKPADIVRYIEGKTQEKSLMAWTKAIDAMKLFGAYQSIQFDDPLIHSVIDDMGGWVKLCHSTDTQLPFLFQEFSRRYEVYLRNPPQEIPRQLTGIFEHQNKIYSSSYSPGIGVPEVIYFDGKKKLSNSHNKFMIEKNERVEKNKRVEKLKTEEKIADDTND